jgi:hypothetical protein
MAPGTRALRLDIADDVYRLLRIKAARLDMSLSAMCKQILLTNLPTSVDLDSADPAPAATQRTNRA